MVLPAHLERRVIGQADARFVDAALAGEHLARHDQRLRARPRFRQAAIDQQLVGPMLHAEQLF